MIELTRGPIDVERVLTALASRAAGALIGFQGTVRDHNAGRRVLHLEYQAFEPMARKEMRAIADRMLLGWPLERVALVHRLGRMKIGETSVLVAVAAAHRGAAFDACRWGIDTLKCQVPIWKKEFFEGGEVWIEGDPGAP